MNTLIFILVCFHKENELSATLFIELDNQMKLQELLVNLRGIEHHLSLVIGRGNNSSCF